MIKKGFYQDCFAVDGEKYMLTISEQGNIDFCLLGHGRRSENGLFWEDDEIFRDANIGVNPMKVFTTVADRVVGWMNSNKKSMVCFDTFSARRIKLYDWLCRRYLKRVPDYYYYRIANSYYFFRKKS